MSGHYTVQYLLRAEHIINLSQYILYTSDGAPLQLLRKTTAASHFHHNIIYTLLLSN